jgi:hypothetical protein
MGRSKPYGSIRLVREPSYGAWPELAARAVWLVAAGDFPRCPERFAYEVNLES